VSLARPTSLLNLFSLFVSAGVVSDAQANQIITLIDNGSHEIQFIFKQYEQHRDVHVLIESLRLASSQAEEVDDDDNDDSNNGDNDDYEDDNDDDDSNGQDDEDDDGLDEVLS
jgi:hypothetical protein